MNEGPIEFLGARDTSLLEKLFPEIIFILQLDYKSVQPNGNYTVVFYFLSAGSQQLLIG